jgi:aspartokinase-like uncharacterized kinase
MHLVVVKIGGSVLFSPKSLDRLINSIAVQYRGSSLFVIVGGGELIEAMRILHRLRPELDGERLHWKCIELLDTSWEIACMSVPSAIPISTASDLYAALANQVPATYLVRVGSFYTETIHANLPKDVRPASNWDTTTDALAWLLAHTMRSVQLVLVKSCQVQENLSLSQAAKDGIVDREVMRLSLSSPGIAVRFLSTLTQAE